MGAVEVLKDMNKRQARKVPDDAPTSFVRKRWKSLVHTPDGLDRRFYELCVLSELKNSLRSGDVWVRGSRQFKDFEEYLLPPSRFSAQREQQALGLAVETDCERFLEARLAVLERELQTVERLAAQDQLPDASISGTGLKLTPLDSAVPPEADALMRCATAASRTSATVPAASTWWSPPSCSGTRLTWNGWCKSCGTPETRTTASCPICRHWAGSTST